MTSLAAALDWPYETKQLVHNVLEGCPNILLGATSITVDRVRSDTLEPPWPDLVIAASRRSAPVARWIKRRSEQSGGRTLLVHLLHAQMPLSGFDLVITQPQFRLPELPNVLHNVGPLNHIDPNAIADAADRFRPRVAALPRPWVALNLGGNSSSYRFTPEVAARLGREASKSVGSGSLLVCTSPRTPLDSTEALFAAIDCPSYLYSFKRSDPDNPYRAFLGLADRFIVTVDSASLAVEACATGRPVQVFAWERRHASWYALSRLLGDADRSPEEPGLAGRAYAGLIYLGLVKPPRDFDAFHCELRARGLTTSFDDVDKPPAGKPLDDIDRAVERIRALFVNCPMDNQRPANEGT
ncbi:MAG: nucleoside-diphosphate sugar epimerase [Myxococcales bacterium]|nr:MAG: nucleoside-diphosphate sugar epimerase [Myxococcales bacterium]